MMPPSRQNAPRGSTDWGAQQILRLLDEEERIAAERERLRALEWRALMAEERRRTAPSEADSMTSAIGGRFGATVPSPARTGDLTHLAGYSNPTPSSPYAFAPAAGFGSANSHGNAGRTRGLAPDAIAAAGSANTILSLLRGYGAEVEEPVPGYIPKSNSGLGFDLGEEIAELKRQSLLSSSGRSIPIGNAGTDAVEALSGAGILENSKGDEKTQNATKTIAEKIISTCSKYGLEVEHTHGGPDLKEYYYSHPVTGQLGSRRPDATLSFNGGKYILDLNTAHFFKRGGAIPLKYERIAAESIRELQRLTRVGQKMGMEVFPKPQRMTHEDWERQVDEHVDRLCRSIAEQLANDQEDDD